MSVNAQHIPSARAVLFDVDDTLVDTKGAFRHALTGVAAEYLASDASLDEVATFWRADRLGFYRAHTRGEMDHREQRMRRANDLHGEFGGEVMGDDAYDAWDALFEQAFRDGWRAFDDAHECLDALEAAGIAYGGLSNARFEYQASKLATVGLERVQMLVGVDTLGFGKPDPAVFAEGCRLLGLEAAEVTYIGDELDIDAVAATSAGLRGVWLDRGGKDEARTARLGEVDVSRVRDLRGFAALVCGETGLESSSVLDGARNTLK